MNTIAPYRPGTIAEVNELASLLYKGGMTSKGVGNPSQLAVRILAGAEVGFSPIQAINNIMVVNGRATIWGDGAIAKVRSSGLLESHAEGVEHFADGEIGAWCEVKRKGEPARRFEFSTIDARQAKLLPADDPSPWARYPERMLTMRARAWALRDVFADVLCGLAIAEEEQDAAAAVAVVSVRTNPQDDPEAVQIGGSVDSGAIANSPTRPVVVPPDDAPVSESILEEIAEARGPWLATIGIDADDADAVRREWCGLLVQWKVERAGQLNCGQARHLLAKLREDVRRSIEEGKEELPIAATVG